MTGKRLTNSIRTLRFHASEMTQGELGEKIGVTRQTVAAIEQGKYSPTLETAFRIADVFGVTLEQVFSWAEE
jgi:putative transcriptional regulator